MLYQLDLEVGYQLAKTLKHMIDFCHILHCELLNFNIFITQKENGRLHY